MKTKIPTVSANPNIRPSRRIGTTVEILDVAGAVNSTMMFTSERNAIRYLLDRRLASPAYNTPIPHRDIEGKIIK